MNFNFKEKNILVTGGSRGIGSAIATQFAELGAIVTITSTTNEKSSFRKLVVDFADLKSTQDFIKKVSEENFDVLVNNAGINKVDSLENIALVDWQKIQDVNLRGPFLTAQTVANSMKKKSAGRIINISSIFGLVTREKRLAYTTSKAGLIGMTKNLALELAPYNILVNSVSPGFIDTELTRRMLNEKEIEGLINLVPIKKLGQPSDIANLVLFLASDLNQFMTGENLVIDGGYTCA